MKNKFFVVISVLMLVTLLLTACQPQTVVETVEVEKVVEKTVVVEKQVEVEKTVIVEVPAEEEQIKIGIISPLTGPQQFEGQLEVYGAKMAVDEVNAAGGLLGRTVTLVIEDTQAQPAQAVSALEKLITKDKIVALQGAQWSSETKAIMPTLEKYGIPAVTAISTAADITEGDLPGKDWLFRVIPHDGLSAGSIGTFLLEKVSAKSIAFIAMNDEWGRGVVNVITPVFEAGGGQVVAAEYFTGGETNFLTSITKIKGLDPDALVLVAQAQDGSVIAKQIKEVGLDKPIVGWGAFASPTFVNLAGDAAEGIYGVVQYSDSNDTPENKALVEMWTTRYPKSGPPDKFAWGPYTAMKAIFEAIKIANSTDPAAIKDALMKVDFMGATGEIKFDEKHQAHPDVFITQIQDGKVVTLSAIKTQ